MDIYMIYQRYKDEVNNNVIIGGLQTYIENLTKLCRDRGYNVIILQYSTFEFDEVLNNGTRLIGITKQHRNWTLDLLRKAERMANLNQDLLIFVTSTQVLKSRFKKTLCIQHGIYWDVPTIHGKTFSFPLDTILRSMQSLREIKTIKSVSEIVCVDYNYINWIRTQILDRTINYTVIPNFTKYIDETIHKNKGEVNIVFARRFEEIRGVDLVLDFIPRILDEFPQVTFTLAGGGRLNSKLHNCFDNNNRVFFEMYSPEESYDFHKKFDIAIIPTIGSEGTSLSLLEAMSAGCTVVCSDVGGMSNIVLDGYNGRIIEPTANAFYTVLKELIQDEHLREQISKRGRETVKYSFSINQWAQKWQKVLEKFEN